MAGKPNFDVQRIILQGNTVFVNGRSGEDDLVADVADIVGITVYLAQGDRIAEASAKPDNPWVAQVPVTDPEGQSQAFKKGPAVAFGVERRKMNLTTTVWAQAIEIKEPPN